MKQKHVVYKTLIDKQTAYSKKQDEPEKAV